MRIIAYQGTSELSALYSKVDLGLADDHTHQQIAELEAELEPEIREVPLGFDGIDLDKTARSNPLPGGFRRMSAAQLKALSADVSGATVEEYGKVKLYLWSWVDMAAVLVKDEFAIGIDADGTSSHFAAAIGFEAAIDWLKREWDRVS